MSAQQVADKQAELTERFMTVLRRRPRPGTALDRVYGYHVQNGSLDELLQSLDVADDAPDAGANQMILGLLQSQRGNTSLAVDAFEKAETLLPDDAMASYQLGKSLLAIGQNEAAAAAMERAIDRNPARNEALAMFTELGRLYGRAGLNEKALQVWTKLEALFPGDVKVGGQIARTLAEEGDYESALARYQQLASSARQPEQQVAFGIQAAEMKRQLCRHDESTEDLELILNRLRPGSWLYANVRERIEEGFLKSGDYDALAEYYKTKLAATPDNLELQIRLGRIYINSRRLDDAVTTLLAALEKAPENSEVRLTLIEVLKRKDDLAAAANQFEKLVDLDPSNPDYLMRWGKTVLADKQRPLGERQDIAIEIWNRLAEARPDDAVILAQVADAFRSIERSELAIKLYRQAVEVAPETPQYREYLGEYLFELDRKDEAIEAWESLAADGRRSRDSLVRLAEIFRTFELDDLSLKAWQDASSLDLTFEQELQFAKTLRERDKIDAAFASLDRAETLAESPDEKEQLLRDRITTYALAGTLQEQIESLRQDEATPNNLRVLALLYAAAGDLDAAYEAINQALQQSPDSVDILLISAEIAERQNRMADAVEKFRRLANLDGQFKTNHLRHLADLQMRLGQTDDAFETCQELIDTNPASSESYQFLARNAFRAGRDDTAITALRKAMSIAPRDNTSRRMLASAFADRYRTDEAIEVYWQAMQYASKLDEQLQLVQNLAPLYDRKTDIPEMIRRIEDMRNDEVDERSLVVLIAAAYETIEDYGAAIKTLESAVVNSPRDVPLLENMVRVCDLAIELEEAAAFQERIVSLEDTPENRIKLIQLQLDADLIDIDTALNDRLAIGADPHYLGQMIRGSVGRMDYETAIAICEAALRRDPSLWDIKLQLAQLLLLSPQSFEPTDGTDGDAELVAFERVLELVEEVRALDLPVETKPPTAFRRTAGPNASKSNQSYNPQSWSNHYYPLARLLHLGTYSNSSSSSNQLAMPNDFGHARVMAATLHFAMIAKKEPDSEASKQIYDLLTTKYATGETDEIEDPVVLWDFRGIENSLTYLTRSSPKQHYTEADRQGETDRMWRLAELDPEHAEQLLRNMLFNFAVQDKTLSGDDAPLPASRIELVKRFYRDAEAKLNRDVTKRSKSDWHTAMQYRMILDHLHTRRGETELANQYAITPPAQDAPFAELMTAINFYLSIDRREPAETLIPRLLPASRNDKQSGGYQNAGIQGTIGTLRYGKASGQELFEKHKFEFLQAILAEACNAKPQSNSRGTSLTDGTCYVYVRSRSGGYYSVYVKCPLVPEVLPENVIREFSSFLPTLENSSGQPTFKIEDAMVAWLDQPVPGATEREQKIRDVLAAYAHWWNEDPAGCYQRLNQLCERYPDDIDLKIEQARLACEIGQPALALEKLNNIESLDSNMLTRTEMAAMNIASQIGDTDRARKAAKRLFGLRIDTNTQLALAEQMRRLGMPEQAKAMMQRLRGQRKKDERTEIQIANAFLANDDEEAAAEVAYSVLRRLNSGRTQSGNADYYRRQVVSVLKKANKLDPLTERAKRRVESAPQSVRAINELMELYTAAGQKTQADELAKRIAKNDKVSQPQLLIAQAEAFKQSGNYEEAVRYYLMAWAKNPNLMQRDFYDMYSPARQLAETDFAFELLNQIPPNAFPGYRISELLRMGRNAKSFSEPKRQFARRMLTRTDADTYLLAILQSIPESERPNLPEIDEALVKAACAEDSFAKDSSFWRIQSYSSLGQVTGALQELVEIANRSEQYGKRLREHAQQTIDKYPESSGYAAQLFLALIDVANDQIDDAPKRDEAVKVIRGLFQDKREQLVKHASETMIWQFGSALESSKHPIEEKNALLRSIFDVANHDPNLFYNSFNLTPSARLADLYSQAGLRWQAHQIMWNAFQTIDHSQDNVSNPGYGDYQDINETINLAESMARQEFAIESFAVYQCLLAEPDKFGKAQRWGGGDMHARTQSASDKAKERLTAETGIQYLDAFRLHIAEHPNDLDSALLDTPIPEPTRTDNLPCILLALRYAKQTEAGRESIQAFKNTVRETSESVPDNRTLSLLQLVLELHSTPASEIDVTESLTNVIATIPSEAELTETVESGNQKSLENLHDLLVPIIVAHQSEHPSATEVIESLSKPLAMIANQTNERPLQLAIMAFGGHNKQQILDSLDLIEQRADSLSTLNLSEIKFCFGIAKGLAEKGDYVDSSRAVEIALRNGLPTRSLNNDSDPFALKTNQSSNPTQNASLLGQIEVTDMLLSTVAMWSKPFGLDDICSPSIDAHDTEESPTNNNAELADKLAQTVLTVLAPQNQSIANSAYAKRIASEQAYDNYNSNTTWEIRSVSLALANLAQQAGTSSQVIEQLRSIEASGDADRLRCAIIVDVAFATDDTAMQTLAINAFAKSLNEVLPAVDAAIVSNNGTYTITQQDQLESWEKSDRVDLCVRTLWPVVSRPHQFDKEDVHTASQLLTRVQKLIGSDHYTQSRHREIARRIERQLFTTSAEVKDEKTFGQQFGNQVESIFKAFGF
ncbi:tetratricopeptide repeat protein [Rhodopirellula sp. MGV]|uniref:tetratricopeptide repeat protein n=1 Tax=Rhodopirellula sp. MGV TaxID=2023130 RepID=UPI001304482C|nr:tetratricopeptide repeat protein [Rhodopirellula sp. MGV]